MARQAQPEFVIADVLVSRANPADGADSRGPREGGRVSDETASSEQLEVGSPSVQFHRFEVIPVRKTSDRLAPVVDEHTVAEQQVYVGGLSSDA